MEEKLNAFGAADLKEGQKKWLDLWDGHPVPGRSRFLGFRRIFGAKEGATRWRLSFLEGSVTFGDWKIHLFIKRLQLFPEIAGDSSRFTNQKRLSGVYEELDLPLRMWDPR